MGRKKQGDEDGADSAVAAATADGPGPDGKPAVRPVNARLKRDPNALRPLYLLVAITVATSNIRVLMTEKTVGRARKLAPRLGNLIERGESGPVILRSKPVE